MRRVMTAAGAILLAAVWPGRVQAASGPERRPELRNSPRDVPLSLRETLTPSPVTDLASTDTVVITGRTLTAAAPQVRLRVTTSLGRSAEAVAPVRKGAFAARYPGDFAGAGALTPGVLFVDATTSDGFDVSRPGHFQAEATLLVMDSARGRIPDLPSAFLNDLRDAAGRVDREACEWPVIRALANLYLRSQAARLCGVGRPDFDLDRTADLEWFRNHLTLYEFDHRDRDWSSPLGARAGQTFWQSVWDTWFNASNDHPLDGDPANTRPGNYTPYAFSNDYADSLLVYLLKLAPDTEPLDDNLAGLCYEGTLNLLAMQHHGADNFALADSAGQRETYTAGAFRYGMFENGVFMTEGTGWFYNPAFRDYAHGGVLNGRCTWALGEALRRAVSTPALEPLVPRLRDGLALSVRFCLKDALPLGYAKRTSAGNVYWRDAGEHAYLALGLAAACAVVPELPVASPQTDTPWPLRKVCAQSLDALVDLAQSHGQWSVYPNVDPMAIAALADGAAVLPEEPGAARWRETAVRVADAWLACRVDPAEQPGAVVHFGPRIAPERMTFNWRHLAPSCANYNTIYFYQTGHWLHALARLYALSGDTRYRDRALAMLAYLCGANPWYGRLFNEIGGVYNWVDDMDGDGVEDDLKQDMYPESTDFCQIGVMHLLRAMAARAPR